MSIMRVELLQYTPDCEKLIAAGAKLCYSNSGIDGLLDNLEQENSDKFLKAVYFTAFFNGKFS